MKNKKLLSLVVALLMTLSLCSLLPQDILNDPQAAAADAQADEQQEKPISIDRKYLTAGQQLNVSNPNGFTLKYFVNKEEAESEPFVLTQDHYEKWITVKAYNGDELVGEDSVYFSKLPVVYINTDDGNDYISKNEYKSAAMDIQNNSEIADSMYSGKISIKGRGNSTWLYPKKPYKIKLDKKADLFSMGKNKSWVLLANYIDECQLRNDTAFDLARQAGSLSVDSVFVNVVLNSEYAGCYQLCEQIKVDPKRVDIFDWEEQAETVASAVCKKHTELKPRKSELEDALKQDLSWVTTDEFEFDGKTYTVSDYTDVADDIMGGYLYELSYEYDELSKFTTPGGLKVMVKSPEYLYTNTDMMHSATKVWLDLEKAYTSENGYAIVDGAGRHYTELADLDSMVSYWLVMEIMGNNDAVSRSRYAYKQQGEHLKFGPVWDFDHYSGTNYSKPEDTTRWIFSTAPNNDNFFKELLDDPLFICTASEKYRKLRPYLKKLVEDGGILDTKSAYLREAGLADSERWNRDEGLATYASGYEKDNELFKKFLKERIEWLDKQFSSDTALIESLYTPTSASPYIKADGKIDISILDSKADTNTSYAAAEHIIAPDTDAQVRINVSGSETATLELYLNGLYHTSIPVKNSAAQCRIESSKLSDIIGKKNVLSIIGKDTSGNTTYRNFTTVAAKYDTCPDSHEWQEPDYIWSEDHSSCTAVITCEKCLQTQTMTVDSTYNITKQPDCTNSGTGTYTAAFEQPFGQSIYNVELSPKGHKWSNAEFSYSDDNTTCTAVRVCENDNSHTDTQAAAGQCRVIKRVNCEQDGIEEYTYTFKDSSIPAQRRIITVPKDHCWSDWKTTEFDEQNNTSAQTRSCSYCGRAETRKVEKAITRLAGKSRYETAAEISRAAFEKADTVVLTYGLNYADALAGVPLAYKNKAPILLTDTSALDTAALEEIKRLGAKSVIILGGEGAISKDVENTLNKEKITTQRISGTTRYGTAAAIAQQLNEEPTDVFFVYAGNFADAISVSSVAAIKGAPIIYLSTSGLLNADTAEYLAELKEKDCVKNAYVIGGEGVISNDMMNSAVSALGIERAVRVAGSDRYRTCVAVNDVFRYLLTGDTLCVATGMNFPDALAGGVYAAKNRSPLLLINGTSSHTELCDEQRSYLSEKSMGLITVFGDVGVLPDGHITDIAKISVLPQTSPTDPKQS